MQSLLGRNRAGISYPLCASCRTKLSRRPVPLGIKLAAVAVAILIVLALTRIPASFSAAASFERGLADEKKVDFATAEEDYHKSLLVYPQSVLLHARLFVAAFKGRDKTVAREEYEFLKDRELDHEIADEINSLPGRND